MNSLLIALLMFATGASQTPPCAQGAGVFYDEMHQFSVTAPRGWCATHVEGGILLTASSAPGGTRDAIHVTLSNLQAAGESEGKAEGRLLREMSSGSAFTEVGQVRTSFGARVRIWRTQTLQPERAQLLAVARVEDMAVRFSMLAQGDVSLHTFSEVVRGLSTNFDERTRPRRPR